MDVGHQPDRAEIPDDEHRLAAACAEILARPSLALDDRAPIGAKIGVSELILPLSWNSAISASVRP